LFFIIVFGKSTHEKISFCCKNIMSDTVTLFIIFIEVRGNRFLVIIFGNRFYQKSLVIVSVFIRKYITFIIYTHLDDSSLWVEFGKKL
jgi:hypothetical protein